MNVFCEIIIVLSVPVIEFSSFFAVQFRIISSRDISQPSVPTNR